MEELGMVLQRLEDVTEGTSGGLEGRRGQVFALHVSLGVFSVVGSPVGVCHLSSRF